MRPPSGPRHLAGALATAVVAAALGTGPAPAAAAPPPAAAAPPPAAAAPPSPAAAGPPTVYAPPVDAPLAEAFRPPANPYAAGNRGIDFAVDPGTGVRAAAAGEVTFAGQVGGSLHVVVLHADGLRTSYSFLAAVAVARGQVVAAGQVLGTAGPSLHFGARAGDRYVDPSLLLAGGVAEVHLVPLEERVPQPAATERRWLVGTITRAAGAGAAAARWLASEGVAAGAAAATTAGDVLAAVAWRAPGPVLAAHAAVALRRSLPELLADQAACTPGSAPLPARPAGRRIVVLVAGYGSTGGDAEVLDVDTGALGYAPEDRVQFSYAGGRVPGVGALAGVRTAGYGPTDAMGDLPTAGQRLRRLLADIAAAHPGVPVDVVAHSQGGLVARAALAVPAGSASAAPVAHLVTLGTPHHGAALATVAGTLGLTERASGLGASLAAATRGGVDPRAPAVAQLAEGSSFLRSLAHGRLPDGVAVTSIAAVGDLVVPALSSTLAGATNTLVPVAGPTAHGRLPGSGEAARALALALGGQAPACVSTFALVGGAAAAAAVSTAEHGLGVAAAPAVAVVDRLVP